MRTFNSTLHIRIPKHYTRLHGTVQQQSRTHTRFILPYNYPLTVRNNHIINILNPNSYYIPRYYLETKEKY